jgi:glycosyltransferase involved in cell wall biosynthesis
MNLLLLGDAAAGDALSEPALWIDEVLRRWDGAGHRLRLIVPPREGGEPALWVAPPSVEAWCPSADDWEATLGDALADPPEVVHVFGAVHFGPRVVETLREQPLLLDVHDFWPICPRADLLRQPGHEPCAEHHPFEGCAACAGLERLRAMDGRAELASHARGIVCHAAPAEERLRLGLGRAVERFDYGVDTLRFRPDPEPARSRAVLELIESREVPRVLFLGPPLRSRGTGLLLDLMVAMDARLDGRVELLVAGRDLDEPDWERMFLAEAAELGLAEHVRTIGRVPPRDLPALIASCEVAIAPGAGLENGLFVLQAMSAGVPVVAHEGSSQAAWIAHGDNGILVDARDVAAFAAATSALLIDPMARSAFAEAARLAVMERHDIARAVAALEELYRKTCGAGIVSLDCTKPRLGL